MLQITRLAQTSTQYQNIMSSLVKKIRKSFPSFFSNIENSSFYSVNKIC